MGWLTLPLNPDPDRTHPLARMTSDRSAMLRCPKDGRRVVQVEGCMPEGKASTKRILPKYGSRLPSEVVGRRDARYRNSPAYIQVGMDQGFGEEVREWLQQ